MFLLRVTIFLILLVSVVLIVPKAAMGQMRYLLVIALYVGAAAFVILLRWPVLGLIMTIIGGMVIPFSGPGGINITVLGILSLLGVWFFDLLVIQQKMTFVPSRTMLPLGLMIIASIIGFIIGQLPWINFAESAPLDAQIGGLLIFLLSVSACILVANLVRSLRWLEWLTWIFIGVGSIYVIGRAGGLPVDRYFQNGVVAGSMFWTWLAALALGQALVNHHLNKSVRAALFLLVAVNVYVVFMQLYDWKSGWIPVLTSIAAIFLIRYPRLARITAPLVLLPAFYYLASRAIATDEYSWGTRLDAWLIVIGVAKASPIFGLGFGNYRYYVIQVPFRGYYSYFSSHSQYVDLFAQVGLFGLAVYAWCFWEIGRLGLWLRENSPEGFALGYVYGALGGIAGTLVAGFLVDWVLPFVYNIGMAGFRASIFAWIFMGGLISLEQMVRSQVTSLKG
jgi:hypothetical protein